LGGLGTFRGAVAGGILLGVAEALAARYVGSSSKDSVALLVLSLVLIFRPTGLLGEAQIVKM
jgi:branched-chain amino acid transport system permease protein